MQLMPGTAKMVARKIGLGPLSPEQMNDMETNILLGTTYLSMIYNQFDGSAVLATAGYNAGPGRARQWIREFGDPRDPKVDPIDWIHRIPFEETREYVQKVLSNVQIYRARLAPGVSTLRIDEDLVRARGNLTISDSRTEAAPASQ